MKLRVVKTHITRSRLLTICLSAAVSIGVLAIIISVFLSSIQKTTASENSVVSNNRTVIIDPGHGGIDGGAVGYGGVVEKYINLSVSLKLKDIFEASGFNVIMTRQDDRSIHDDGSNTVREKKVTDIHNRAKLLTKYPGAVFISIHQNKFEQSKYSGTQVFYSKNNDSSKLLAQFIQTNVKEMLQHENDRKIKPAGKNLYILYHAKSPAVMVECGFLSNQNEAALLQNSAYQTKMAFAIYCGTLDYYAGEINYSSSS